METITFYAYKGGTGRSLLVANIARYLGQFGQRVVVVDFDLEAPGLHYKFGLAESDNRPTVGLVDYLWAKLNLQPEPSLEEMLVQVPGPKGPGDVWLLPAGSGPGAQYWKKLGSIDWHSAFYSDQAVGVPLFLDLKERIREEVSPDFLIIDSRTGITEMGGVATTLLPDKVVCLLLLNKETLEGSRAVLRAISSAELSASRVAPKIFPVVSRMPGEFFDERKELDRVSKYLTECEDSLSSVRIEDVHVIHSDPSLQVVERVHIGTSSEDGIRGVLLRDYLRLFASIIPAEKTREHVGQVIEPLREQLFEDPESTVRELEGLAAYLGHADLYRELLKVYRIRKESGLKVLRAAFGLWNVRVGSEDFEIVRQAVTQNLGYLTDGNEPLGDDREQWFEFLQAVWVGGDHGREVFGENLLNLLIAYQSYHRAGAFAEEFLARIDEPSVAALTSVLKALAADKRFSAGTTAIQSNRKYWRDRGFVQAWAELELSSGTVSSDLVGLLEVLVVAAPDLAAEVVRMAVDPGGMEQALHGLIEGARKFARRADYVSVLRFAIALGVQHLFEPRLRNLMSPDEFEVVARAARSFSTGVGSTLSPPSLREAQRKGQRRHLK